MTHLIVCQQPRPLVTHLTAVRGFIQLLHENLRKSPKRDFLQVALDELDRANSLIKDFLLFVRPAAPNFSLVPLDQVIEEALSIVKQGALKKGINFEFYSAKNYPLMYLDQEQICRAIANVLQNSLDFSERGPIKIKVVNDEKFGRIVLSVKDRGSGIAPQNMSRFLNLFSRRKKRPPVWD